MAFCETGKTPDTFMEAVRKYGFLPNCHTCLRNVLLLMRWSYPKAVPANVIVAGNPAKVIRTGIMTTNFDRMSDKGTSSTSLDNT